MAAMQEGKANKEQETMKLLRDWGEKVMLSSEETNKNRRWGYYALPCLAKTEVWKKEQVLARRTKSIVESQVAEKNRARNSRGLPPGLGGQAGNVFVKTKEDYARVIVKEGKLIGRKRKWNGP